MSISRNNNWFVWKIIWIHKVKCRASSNQQRAIIFQSEENRSELSIECNSFNDWWIVLILLRFIIRSQEKIRITQIQNGVIVKKLNIRWEWSIFRLLKMHCKFRLVSEKCLWFSINWKLVPLNFNVSWVTNTTLPHCFTATECWISVRMRWEYSNNSFEYSKVYV